MLEGKSIRGSGLWCYAKQAPTLCVREGVDRVIMRIRYTRAAALASSAITVGAVLLAGSVPAFANETETFYVINAAGTPMYMVSNNDPSTPLFVSDGGASETGTDFSDINGTKEPIDGGSPAPVYEWEELNSNRCWEYDASDSGYLFMVTCSPGNANQLFWSRTNGQIVNVAASNAAGTLFCVNATHSISPGGTGEPINVIACKSKTASGGFDQYWKGRA
jgi:hypothetical protein